jgi:hypothetical protein
MQTSNFQLMSCFNKDTSMAQTSATRAWWGGYEVAGERVEARTNFFRAVERHAPEVLISLQRDVLPVCPKVAPGDLSFCTFVDFSSPAMDDAVARWAAHNNLIRWTQSTGQAVSEATELTRFHEAVDLLARYTLFRWAADPTTRTDLAWWNLSNVWNSSIVAITDRPYKLQLAIY